MRSILLALACASLALGASAAEFSDFYVIPVAAHLPGANGTTWRTDVAIQNFQSTPVTVDFALVRSGEGLADNVVPLGSSVTIPPGGNMTIPDVLASQQNASGALLVGGDHAFAITSRTFNSTANGTFGQTVPAAQEIATSGDDDASTLYVPGVVQNAKFRTNIGLVISATSPMTVTVSLNDANGQPAGTRTFNVASGVTTHVQFPVTSIAGSNLDSAGAVIHITAGSGTVIAYASVVDNTTGDASFISGGTAAAGAITPLSLLFNRR
jgi:hypothetical protein